MRSSDELRLYIADYIQAFNSRDFERVAALYAENATLEDPVGSGVKHGRDEIRAFYEQYRDQASFLQLTGDFRFPDNAVAFTFFCYMGDPSDPMIVEVTDTFRFDAAGLITEMRAFWGAANVHGHASRQPRAGLQHPFAGQVALITGTGGQAQACCISFATSGAHVIVAAPAGEAEAIVDAVRAAGGRARPLPTDLDNPAALEGLPAAAKRLGGRLDVRINLFGPETLLATSDSPGRVVNVTTTRPTEVTRTSLDGPATVNWIVASHDAAPGAVADAATWLCLPLAGSIDGAVIVVPG